MPENLVLPGEQGDFTLDARTVAEAFGFGVQELRDNMRRGLVTSVVERGEGEDQGRWRLSLRCGNRRWQVIVAPDGTITEQHIGFTRIAS